MINNNEFCNNKGINMYYTCYKTHLYAMMTKVHTAITGISRLDPLYLSTLHDSELSCKTDHTL